MQALQSNTIGKYAVYLQHGRTAIIFKLNLMNTEILKIAELVTKNILYTTKEVLTMNEVAQYMGISKSYLYKLTMKNKIPFYKPTGKICYFNRKEIEDWLQSNRASTDEELNQKAAAYCMSKQMEGTYERK